MLLQFLIPAFIWGSTWIAITFQLGSVAPEVSVLYRFVLATAFSFAYLKIKKIKLNIPGHIQKWLAVQGICNFCINYILTYYAESFVASGLIAVTFGLLPFFNAIGMSFIFKQKLETKTILGIFSGGLGTVFIFHEQLLNFSTESKGMLGLSLGILATLFASAGNLSATKFKKENIPVLVTNSWAMLYGTVATFLYIIFSKTQFSFDSKMSYILALIYLALFGTVIAFSFYYDLIRKIGAARAGYTTILTHVIALIISGIFENFKWETFTFVGVFFSLFGNYLIISAKKN